MSNVNRYTCTYHCRNNLTSLGSAKNSARIEMTNSDGQVSFKCIVGSQPQPSIIWRKDHSALRIEGRYSVRSDGTLDISVPSVGDEGDYSCLALNDAGQQISEATFRYYGVDGKDVLRVVVNKISYFCIIFDF